MNTKIVSYNDRFAVKFSIHGNQIRFMLQEYFLQLKRSYAAIQLDTITSFIRTVKQITENNVIYRDFFFLSDRIQPFES